VIALRSETWGRIAGLWSPFAVVGLLALGRRYYQRFGTVLESRQSLVQAKRQTVSLWLIALLMGTTILNAVTEFDD